MSALIDLVEVDQVGIGAPRPRLRGSIDLVREYRDGHRERDLGGLLRGRAGDASSGVLPVDARCGGAGVRQPVQRDVVQHVVFRRRLLGIGAIRPFREARMPKQPCGEAGRRVGHAVADVLRPRRHHRDVGRVPHLGVSNERVEHLAFLLGESGRRRPTDGDDRGHFGRYCPGQVDVNADQSLEAPAVPSSWQWGSPSRRPGRHSVCTRGASSAPPRLARYGRAPNRCRSAFRKSRSPVGTGSRRRRRPRRGRRAHVGSVSGPMILSCSMTEPGHPCVTMSGSAF